MEKKYVSNIITDKVIEELKQGGNYLIGSEMGSGKNYWIEKVLLPFADSLSKKTLILSHRKATKTKTDFQLKEWENSQMRKFRGGLFQNMTYQALKNRIERNEYQFLNQFDYIVCDEAHFFTNDCDMESKVEWIFDWLNDNNKAIKFFLTGTYESFFYLPWNNIKQLKQADYYNSMVEALWGYGDINSILPILEEKIVNGEKILCVFNKIQEGKEFMLSTSMNTALLTSGNQNDNVELDSIVYNETINSDCLVSTILVSEGLEIKDDVTKTIVLNNITQIEKFVQTTARVRDNKVNVYYKKPSINKIRKNMDKFEKLLDLIDEFEQDGEINYVKKYGIELIQKNHKFLYLDTVIDPMSGQEYSRVRIHKCNVANIQFQYDMYLEMYENGFEYVLRKYFPNAVIYDFEALVSQNLIESKIIDDFIDRKLFKEEQNELKNILIREYGLRKSLGYNKINEEFRKRNITFEIESNINQTRDENYKKRYWVLKRV